MFYIHTTFHLKLIIESRSKLNPSGKGGKGAGGNIRSPRTDRPSQSFYNPDKARLISLKQGWRDRCQVGGSGTRGVAGSCAFARDMQMICGWYVIMWAMQRRLHLISNLNLQGLPLWNCYCTLVPVVFNYLKSNMAQRHLPENDTLKRFFGGDLVRVLTGRIPFSQKDPVSAIENAKRLLCSRVCNGPRVRTLMHATRTHIYANSEKKKKEKTQQSPRVRSWSVHPVRWRRRESEIMFHATKIVQKQIDSIAVYDLCSVSGNSQGHGNHSSRRTHGKATKRKSHHRPLNTYPVMWRRYPKIF